MECDELDHIFQEFPDKGTADAWNILGKQVP